MEIKQVSERLKRATKVLSGEWSGDCPKCGGNALGGISIGEEPMEAVVFECSECDSVFVVYPPWYDDPATKKQKAVMDELGIKYGELTTKGEASVKIDSKLLEWRGERS